MKLLLNCFFTIISLSILLFLIKVTSPGCSYNCREYYSLEDCKSCHDGYYLDKTDSNHYKCCNCPSNCKTCSSSSSCSSCDEGYYLSGGQCKKCSSPCFSCTGSANSCSSCINGYYLSSQSCIKCNDGCSLCNNSNYCLICSIDGYVLEEFPGLCLYCNIDCKTTSENCKCNNCYDGYYLAYYQCLECDSNCKTCTNKDSNCNSCYEGYYWSNYKCLSCNSGCKICSGSASNCLT